MASLSDVSDADLKKLAGYLKRFPSDDDEAEQFWYQLACVLRRRRGNTYNYSEQFLVDVGQTEDKAAWVFLKDLRGRGIQLDDLVQCLKTINCHQALRLFEPGEATPPEIAALTEQERHKSLRVGETLQLDVEVTGAPGSLRYVWYHNDRALPSNNSPQLVIGDVNTGHTGMYRCKVTNPAIADQQTNFTLSQAVEVQVLQDTTIIRQETAAGPVRPAPVIVQQPSSVTVYKGQRHRKTSSVTFQCRAEESVTYDWYKDGKLLPKSCTDGELVLRNVSMADEGVYHCVVVNDGGRERSSKVTLSVKSDIEVMTQPSPARVRVNDLLRLTCSARSTSNQLSYKWFRMDKTQRGERELQLVGEDLDLSLTVTDEHLTSKGKYYYRCKVTDGTDPTNYVYSNTVEVKVDTVWIIEEPRDVHAVIKQRAQLTCTGGGANKLSYIWLKSPTRTGRFEVVPKANQGVLSFESLTNLDSGYYQCQVESGSQFKESRVVQVKALLPHAVEAVKTQPVIKVIQEPRSCAVTEGAHFKLVFKVACSTADTLSYQWYFTGSKISGATSSTYSHSSTSLSDCGSYWCSVRAGEGPTCIVSQSARVELQYKEKHPPGSGWRHWEGERYFRTLNEERFAREKIALLIGNSRYQHTDLSKLETPEHDITALQKVLQDSPFNFKVFSMLDLTHDEMNEALEMFYSLLQPMSGTYALFYFSGHGFSTDNHNNFLVPVNSEPCPSQCFQVDTIARRMQDTLSRAILILDACKVVNERPYRNDSTAYSSIGNTSNMFELWSCVDRTTASDGDSLNVEGDSPADVNPWGAQPRSHFSIALLKAIEEQKYSLNQINDHLPEEMIRYGSRQRPVMRTSLSDVKITLHDPIMVDNPDLVSHLDKVFQHHTSAHAVPEPVVFGGDEMNDLKQFAKLRLSFALPLTNVLCVSAELHQLSDKTSLASVNFDTEFSASLGVSCSQKNSKINGKEEGVCARGSLLVRGLQKLVDCPLKLLINVCLVESGQERHAAIEYKFKQLPYINIKKCS